MCRISRPISISFFCFLFVVRRYKQQSSKPPFMHHFQSLFYPHHLLTFACCLLPTNKRRYCFVYIPHCSCSKIIFQPKKELLHWEYLNLKSAKCLCIPFLWKKIYYICFPKFIILIHWNGWWKKNVFTMDAGCGFPEKKRGFVTCSQQVPSKYFFVHHCAKIKGKKTRKNATNK